MKSEVSAARVKLEEERAEFQKERAQQREELRKEKVRVFLGELKQPDGKGGLMDAKTHLIISAILLGEDVLVTDEYSVQLSETVSVGSVHAYYREAIEALAGSIPRVVPTSSQVEPADEKPDPNAVLSEERRMKREAKILAKEESSGTKLTQEELKAVDAELDRFYGEVE